jgi:hypothetical protein
MTTSKITIAEIVSILDRMAAAGAPSWKLELAYQDLRRRRQRGAA